MNITHFPTAADFRRWLDQNHATATEHHVGFFNKKSGRGGLTYQEAVHEALCFGWIDGIVHKLDADSYTHRFTPRKSGSIWSNVNVAHVARLTAAGRMHPAGLAAFAARTARKTGIYAFEQKQPPSLPPVFRKKFRSHKKAWAFFTTQAPSYQHRLIHKIVTAKQAATRERWLARLIAASAAGERL